MNRWLKIGIAFGLFVVLVLVRAFENQLFYDPLIQFFKLNHSTEVLPQFNTVQLSLYTSLRFFINTLVSLAILWVLFQRKEIIKVSALLYAIVFVILFIAFLILIQSSHVGGHMALFYVRRFLIQPIFLLLLIPAFYFQKNA